MKYSKINECLVWFEYVVSPIAITICFMLFISGCSDDKSAELRDLKNQQRETELKLNSCQSSLEMYRNVDTGSPSTEVETQTLEPQEPSCEVVEYQTITMDNKKTDSCLASSVTSDACGINATDCDSGQAYACLHNVSYKTFTKKICE